MKEYVYRCEDTKEAHLVDEELLQCLQNVLQNDKAVSDFTLTINCDNDVRYDFSSADELLKYSKENRFTISSLKMKCSYRKDSDSYSKDSIEITFHNENDRSFFESSCNVRYDFHDEKTYYFMKRKIESILKSKKPMYSVLSRIPLIWIGDCLAYCILCVYTWINGIVFPKEIQSSISFICWVILFVPILPLSRTIKLSIFPKSDFAFGLLERKSKKMAALRSFIWKGIILTIAIGIIINMISNFFTI